MVVSMGSANLAFFMQRNRRVLVHPWRPLAKDSRANGTVRALRASLEGVLCGSEREPYHPRNHHQLSYEMKDMVKKYLGV